MEGIRTPRLRLEGSVGFRRICDPHSTPMEMSFPSTLTDSQWNNANAGATTIYGEDDGCTDYSPDLDSCDPVVALEEYGRLYNWYAVDDSRGLCPSGWHVPSQTEWQSLISSQGGSSSAGEALKSTYGWSYSGQGTNSSQFSGMPGGKRQDGSGYYTSAGDKGIWWTSTPYASLARYVELKFNSNGVTQSYSDREEGIRYGASLTQSSGNFVFKLDSFGLLPSVCPLRRGTIDKVKHLCEPCVTTVIRVWHILFWKEHLAPCLASLSVLLQVPKRRDGCWCPSQG